MTHPNTPSSDYPDFTETRVHILTAGRELLLAAKGALQFCNKFVENQQTSAPHVKDFFKKAITVADDLSSGLKSVEAIKRAASSAITPIFTTLENEFAREARTARPASSTERTATPRATKGTRSRTKK